MENFNDIDEQVTILQAGLKKKPNPANFTSDQKHFIAVQGPHLLETQCTSLVHGNFAVQ